MGNKDSMAFMNALKTYYENRQIKAAVSKATSPVIGIRARAWPHLSQFGAIGDSFKSRVVSMIASMYMYYKSEFSGNFGETCRLISIELSKNNPTKENKGFTIRFNGLLNSDTEMILTQVVRIIQLAKHKSVPVNYERLYLDLLEFEQYQFSVLSRWGYAYWAQDKKEE